MKKYLLIAGAVCALAFFTTSAEASHRCRTGYGFGGGSSFYGGGARGGFNHFHGHNHRGFNQGRNSFYAPRRIHGYHGRRNNCYRPGVHFGGRQFSFGIRF